MPETKTDPAEAAAREVCNYTDEMRAWGESTPGEVSEVAAIIRRHMAEHLQKIHGAAMNLLLDDAKLMEAMRDTKDTGMAYKLGHRDARHAAAEAIVKSLDA